MMAAIVGSGCGCGCEGGGGQGRIFNFFLIFDGEQSVIGGVVGVGVVVRVGVRGGGSGENFQLFSNF